MKTILICGSRHWNTKRQEAQAQNTVSLLVQRCKQKGHNVIVGDASGVDAWVVAECEAQSVPYTCYGLADIARNGARVYVKNEAANNYTERDFAMVDKADFVACIYNGSSNGTHNVSEYARMVGTDYKVWTIK